MSDTAESPGSPKQEQLSPKTSPKTPPKTPPSTPQDQDNITVIKGSEAEELKARETVVAKNDISVSVNGMDVTVTSSVNGAEAQKVSEKAEVEPEAVSSTSAGSMQEDGADARANEEGANASANGEGEDFEDEEDMESWIVRRLTDEEINDILGNYPQIPQKDMNQCLDFFWGVDQKGYGFFTIREFHKVMKQKRKNLTDKQIAAIFSDLDRDHDLIVSLDEFLDEMSKKKFRDLSKEDIRPVFESIDMDQDGIINEQDFEKWCLYNLKVEGMTDSLMKALQKDIHYSQWGGPKVDLDYFVKLVKRHMAPDYN